jgi:hypothetical protein
MSDRTTIIGAPSITIDDFVGTWIPTGVGTFEWVDGPLTAALKDPTSEIDALLLGPSLTIHCAERIPTEVWAELAQAVSMLRNGGHPPAVAGQARFQAKRAMSHWD